MKRKPTLSTGVPKEDHVDSPPPSAYTLTKSPRDVVVLAEGRAATIYVGADEVEDYLENMRSSHRRDLASLRDLLSSISRGEPIPAGKDNHMRHNAAPLRELTVRQHRFLLHPHDGSWVLVHAFLKKTNATRAQDIERGKQVYAAFFRRMK